MTNHEHERAIDLVTRRGVEDVAAPDIAWLDRTWRCAPSVPSTPPGREHRAASPVGGHHGQPGAGGSTQTRVHERAAQLREHQARVILIAVSFCIGVLSSTLSAWLWWRFGGWVAERLSLPSSIVEPGMFVAWLLPAIVIALAMLASSRPVIDRSVTLAMLGEREGDRQ